MMNRYAEIIGVVLVALFVVDGINAGLGGKMVGGYSKIEPENGNYGKNVQDALLFAVEELQRRDNSLYQSQPGPIMNAESQVVAGTNYRITFELQYTNCRIKSHMGVNEVEPENCRATKISKCTVEVWDQPWRTPRMQLTKYECGGSQAVRQP